MMAENGSHLFIPIATSGSRHSARGHGSRHSVMGAILICFLVSCIYFFFERGTKVYCQTELLPWMVKGGPKSIAKLNCCHGWIPQINMFPGISCLFLCRRGEKIYSQIGWDHFLLPGSATALCCEVVGVKN